MTASRARVAALAVAVVVVAGAVVWQRSSQDDRGYCDAAVVHELPEVTVEEAGPEVGFQLRGVVEDAVAAASTGGGRTYVAARRGELWRVGEGAPVRVLDLTSEVATGSLEQGLLGVVLSPDESHVYVHATLLDGTATVLEYEVDAAGDVVGDSRREVISLEDPAPTHNGGRIAFGADGLLYLALGDGGDGATTGASQDLGSPFGKLLRIDPAPSGGLGYSIPPDNPFVGVDGARPEVWASGFRNPWGWSFDRGTGDLWVGDVGQLCFEELSWMTDGGRGGNFGWSHTEGSHAFTGPGLGQGGAPDPDVPLADLGPTPEDLVGPVYEYPHAPEACSVIGGFVYRGAALPELVGSYLWADLCERSINTLTPSGDGWVRSQLAGEIPAGIVAFSEGPDGELAVVSISEGVFTIVPSP